ncbi:Magnesium transporter NIPA [Cynara cardunculus var. scolymus]|uniref:Magnesium transporter NIPA n=1 Tax=Cynara cardunculus var. scolymus TaxID=59895 RepID=A0A103XD73_CYNCS|nr:Magnesium transporter NIPA [Cynara cardunculus var. scolymus]
MRWSPSIGTRWQATVGRRRLERSRQAIVGRRRWDERSRQATVVTRRRDEMNGAGRRLMKERKGNRKLRLYLNWCRMASQGWTDAYRGMSADNIKGLILALSSSLFIGASFIVKKKGLIKAGASGTRAGVSSYLLFSDDSIASFSGYCNRSSPLLDS